MAEATRQKLLYKDKDDQWRKESVQYVYQRCMPNNLYFDSLYKAANGEIDVTDYSYVTNPYGNAVANRPELQSYPAKLKNYPIIPEIIQLLLGEKRDRPLLASVIAVNPDTINKKKSEEVIAMKSALKQIFINTLNDLGMDTNMETKPVPPLDQFMDSLNDSWADQRSVVGQEVLNYLIEDLDIPEKFIQGFKHWIVTATTYTIKDVINDDVVYRILNPKYVGFIADENTEYIEDAEAVCVQEFLSKASFFDRYWSLIRESIIPGEDLSANQTYDNITNDLDRNNASSVGPNPLTFGSGNFSRGAYWGDSGNVGSSAGFTSGVPSSFYGNTGDEVKVTYVNWTSMKLIKRISVLNEFGEQEIVEVPDNYKIEKEFGEELVNEYWVNEKWEGYVVDDNRYYFGVQPLPIQRNLLNNKSSCKNLINGRIRRMGDRKAFSVVELLMPFQHLYNMLHYKRTNIIAKNKDKILLMPVGLISNKNGLDMFGTMFHADANGILWIDETADNAAQAINAIKAIDLGLGSYVDSVTNVMMTVKMEAEAVVGINQQRKANVSGKAGLGVTDTAIAQSHIITADLFEDYEKFQEKELCGLLDISRFAFLNGKKAAYLNSAGRTAFLEIAKEDEDFCNSEFGVRVTSSAKEKEKLNKMKAFAETLASQKVKASQLAVILNAESNFSKLITELKALEAQEEAIAQQQSQAEADMKNQELQAKMTQDQQKLNLEYYKVDQNNITAEKVALIQSETTLLGLDKNLNGVDDSVEVAKNALDRDKHFNEIGLKKQELDLKAREIEIKANTEIYKADTSLKVAKENKNSSDTPKKKK